MTTLTDIEEKVNQVYGIAHFQTSAIAGWIEALHPVFEDGWSEHGDIKVIKGSGTLPKLPLLAGPLEISLDLTFSKEDETLVGNLTACPRSGAALSVPGLSSFNLEDLQLTLTSRMVELDLGGEKILFDSLSASFGGTIQLGENPISILVQFPSADSNEWTLEWNFKSLTLTSVLEELTQLAGAETGWIETLPTQILGLGSFAVEEMRLSFDPTIPSVSLITLDIAAQNPLEIIPGAFTLENPRIWMNIDHPGDAAQRLVHGAFSGTAQVGGEEGAGIYLSADVPEMRFYGALTEGSSIHFTKLLSHLLPEVPLHDAPNLELDDLNIRIDASQPDAKTFSIYARCYSDWEILPGIMFTCLQTAVDYDGKAGVGAKLISVFNIGGVDVTLLAAHPQGEGGWQFEGSTGPGQEIPIGKLVEDMVRMFGVQPVLPTPLEELVIKDLGVSFNTQSKDFKFTCAADLPVSAASSLAVQLSIDVKHVNGACQVELGGQFDVTVEASILEFKLEFEHDKKSDKVTAAYRHDGKLPLNISALVKGLASGDNELAGLIAGLDIAVDLETIQLAFCKVAPTPAGPARFLFGMDLCAGVSFSDPSAESGTRTTEIEGLLYASFNRASPAQNNAPGETSESSKYLFGVFIGAEFNLSNLPLVGKEISLEQTIGVKDLQLFVASQALQAADTEQLIGLLSPTKLTLPKQEAEAGQPDDAQKSQPANILERGLTSTAVLVLGAESHDLVLSPSAGQALPTKQKEPPLAASDTSLIAGEQLGEQEAPAPAVKWIKIQRSFGPFRFDRIGFQYQDQVIWFLLDASLSAAGLALSLDGLGFGSSLTRFEPQFDLHGLGVQFKKGEVEISGAFLKTAVNEYSGKAVLKTTKFSLSAIGSYATLNGQPSMFIYAVLNYPLGGPPFFFVTGLAAGFGYNRSLVMPPVDQVKQFPLVQEACADQTPAIANAGEALEKIKEYVPAQTGQYFLAAGIRFTSFKMIDSFALLAVSFGQHLEINILGISTIKIPYSTQAENKPCLAEIQVAFKASFIPDEGFLGVIAQLTPSSYILDKNCHLTGGLAFYYWFSGEHAGDFVLTVGGYHSSFSPPAHYPQADQVHRLAIGWRIDSCLSIKGDAYFALTPTLLMAGGHLEATWQSGPLKAWFTAGADFLIAWKPFHYDAHLYVDMGVSYTFWFFGTHHITAGLGADLHVWGPEFSGTAHIHLWFISFTIAFGPSQSQVPKPISWQEFESSFLPAGILSISVKNGLVSQSDMDEATHLGIINPKDFWLVVDSLVPVKTSPNYSEPGNGFGIAPMDISELETVLTITMDGIEHPVGVEFTPVKKNLPAGLWGTKFQPDLQSEALVKDVISGCEIQTRDPTSSTEPIEYSTLHHDPDRKALDFQWEKGISVSTEQKTESARRQAMKDCLTRTNQVRQGILAGLGLESMEITMDENIADVFMFAPQILATDE